MVERRYSLLMAEPHQKTPEHKETDQKPQRDDNQELEWSKHLFDEWKYRHEAFWKMQYRYSWYLLVLAVLPSAGGNTEIQKYVPGVDLFVKVGAWYWFAVAVLWIGATVHLCMEHTRLKAVEDRMMDCRDSHKPLKPGWTQYRKTIWRVCCWSIFWVVLYLFFFFQATHRSASTTSGLQDKSGTATQKKLE
jgi:hypothetical protein